MKPTPWLPLAAVTSFMQPLREGICNSEYSELCIKTRIAFFGNLYLEAWPLQLGHAHRLRSDFENRGILRNFCLRGSQHIAPIFGWDMTQNIISLLVFTLQLKSWGDCPFWVIWLIYQPNVDGFCLNMDDLKALAIHHWKECPNML